MPPLMYGAAAGDSARRAGQQAERATHPERPQKVTAFRWAVALSSFQVRNFNSWAISHFWRPMHANVWAAASILGSCIVACRRRGGCITVSKHHCSIQSTVELISLTTRADPRCPYVQAALAGRPGLARQARLSRGSAALAEARRYIPRRTENRTTCRQKSLQEELARRACMKSSPRAISLLGAA